MVECGCSARIFATGHSNGGQFAWALGARLASGRLAAIAPSAGTPHTGFGEGVPPGARPVSIMDVHGMNDNTCPANSTEPSNDGWYYEMVPIMCDIFARADGCDPEYVEHYPTSFDHQQQMYCVQQGKCEEEAVAVNTHSICSCVRFLAA